MLCVGFFSGADGKDLAITMLVKECDEFCSPLVELHVHVESLVY